MASMVYSLWSMGNGNTPTLNLPRFRTISSFMQMPRVSTEPSKDDESSYISDLTSSLSSPHLKKTTISSAGRTKDIASFFYLQSSKHSKTTEDDKDEELKLDEDDDDDSDYLEPKRELKRDHYLDSEDDEDGLSLPREKSPMDHVEQHLPKKTRIEKARRSLKTSSIRGTTRINAASNADTKSKDSNISFKERMLQLSKLGNQDMQSNRPFVYSMEKDKVGECFCNYCGDFVNYAKFSTIKGHIQSRAHQDGILRFQNKKSMQEMFAKHVAGDRTNRLKSGIGTRLSSDVEVDRLRLCYAFLRDGISFSCLNEGGSNLNGLYSFLTEKYTDITYRSVRDKIPSCLNMEREVLVNEMKNASHISVIFDATPDRGQAVGVCIQYVTNTLDVTQRCLDLSFYDSDINANNIGTFLFRSWM